MQVIQFATLNRSLPYSLTHSLSQSRTRSLIHPFTQSSPHQLNCSLIVDVIISARCFWHSICLCHMYDRKHHACSIKPGAESWTQCRCACCLPCCIIRLLPKTPCINFRGSVYRVIHCQPSTSVNRTPASASFACCLLAIQQ